MNKQLKYQRAEMALKAVASLATSSGHSVVSGCLTRSAVAKSLMAAESFLSVTAIEQAVHQQCSRGRLPHACLDNFRSNPGIVRNWRLLWKSLPRYRRDELLMQLLRSGKLTFMGVEVCCVAFQILTHISAGKLQKVREHIKAGKQSVWSASETQVWMSIRQNSKAKLYLATCSKLQHFFLFPVCAVCAHVVFGQDARQWIERYAETHGEQSPMTSVVYLPAGRRSLYYEAYCHDRSTGLG